MQIARYLSLNEQQFLGCVSAFVDVLSSEMSGALMNLRRLENRGKGSAFAFEMAMDRARYGALIVLERWTELHRAFHGHASLGALQSMFDQAPERAAAAAKLIEQTNHLIDRAEVYSPDVVAACEAAFRTVDLTFSEEREAAAKSGALAELGVEDYRDYRRVFAGDLAAR